MKKSKVISLVLLLFLVLALMLPASVVAVDAQDPVIRQVLLTTANDLGWGCYAADDIHHGMAMEGQPVSLESWGTGELYGGGFLEVVLWHNDPRPSYIQSCPTYNTAGFLFHGHPAIHLGYVSSNMQWEAGRFVFSCNNKSNAEVLYANAAKYGLNIGPSKPPSKQTVCASAKPRIADASEFTTAEFTIGGTEPQEVRITQPAENFAIVNVYGGKYGGIVYQRIKGESWGSLTLEPGTYRLSCSGGGAMNLMSATVCIEYPAAKEVPPSDNQTVPPKPKEKEKPPMEEVKPSLPRGPIEKIIIRPQDNLAATKGTSRNNYINYHLLKLHAR